MQIREYNEAVKISSYRNLRLSAVKAEAGIEDEKQ